jgi:ABC-type lipoprotein export system ATPase subunit
MSTAELKIDLISRIANTKESRIIEELRKLLDFELDKDAYELNPQQQQRVCEAKAEYLTGNVLSEQQADEAIDQWLSAK